MTTRRFLGSLFLVIFCLILTADGNGGHYVKLSHRKGTTCAQNDYVQAQYIFGQNCTVGTTMCKEAVSPLYGPVSSTCVQTMEDLPFSAAVGALFEGNDTTCSDICVRARIWMLDTCNNNMTVSCQDNLIMKKLYNNTDCNGTEVFSKTYTTGVCAEASPETWGFPSKFMCV